MAIYAGNSQTRAKGTEYVVPIYADAAEDVSAFTDTLEKNPALKRHFKKPSTAIILGGSNPLLGTFHYNTDEIQNSEQGISIQDWLLLELTQKGFDVANNR